MNRDTFLQWCADGKFKDIEQILSEHCHDEMLCPFDHGFGAPTQSLLEQAIEVSLVHENRCWLPLLQCLSKHPEQMYAFAFGQLLYWDVSHQLVRVLLPHFDPNSLKHKAIMMASKHGDEEMVEHLFSVCDPQKLLEDMHNSDVEYRDLHLIRDQFAWIQKNVLEQALNDSSTGQQRRKL